jgi:hypothetical protein
MLHAVANAFRLQHHAQINQRWKIFGQTERVQHLPHHQAVTAVILLVPFHDVGGHVPIFFVGVGTDGGQRRQRLKAKLAHKAGELAAVGGDDRRRLEPAGPQVLDDAGQLAVDGFELLLQVAP